MSGDVHAADHCWCGGNHAADAYQQGYDAGRSAATPEPDGLDVLREVAKECQRAADKFGLQSDSTDERWLAIIMEEVGESATEVLRVGNPGLDALLKRSRETGIGLEPEDIDGRIRLRKEVVQVAAVAVRWIQSMDARLSKEPIDV